MSEAGTQASATTGKRAVRGYKIVVLGDGGVGKSALTMQFVCHQFLDYHDPTIEDVYQHQARIDGEPAQLEILDTAGQPEFTAMREQYMRAGEGFVVCYSVIARRSFDEALEYKKLIDRVRSADTTPIVLVANKCDLEHLRKVSTEEGRALASQWDCPFFETSAAQRVFVDDAFHGLVCEIRRREGSRKKAALKLKKAKSSPFRQFLRNFNVLKKHNGQLNST